MNIKLKPGDTIAIVACSNGYPLTKKQNISNLESIFNSISLNIKYSSTLYNDNERLNDFGYKRALDLCNFFSDTNIKAIFDISGGDLCNEILDYVDFEIIKANPKPFFGYSDLSVLLNAIYTQTELPTFSYQIRNLIGKYNITQTNNFTKLFFENSSELLKFNYKFLRGSSISGIVIGGNIRCILKLSGTKYMPNFNNKILFLESLGGDINKIRTYLTQLRQLGAFNLIDGIILGTFTELETLHSESYIDEFFLNFIPSNIPIIKTNELGHGENSKCIIIGKTLNIINNY